MKFEHMDYRDVACINIWENLTILKYVFSNEKVWLFVRGSHSALENFFFFHFYLI